MLDVPHADYNEHRQKHTLKFQTFTAPDGLNLYASELKTGCHLYCALYTASAIKMQLETACYVNYH